MFSPLTRIGIILALVAASFIGFRVWLAAHDRAIISEMVTQAEADALAAVLAREQAKRAAAEAMATEERNRAAAALRVKQQQADEIERLTEAAKAIPGLSYPTPEDLQWENISR